MNTIALAAHMRLAAALPARRHTNEPKEPVQRSLVGYPTEGARPGRAAPEDSPLRRKVVRSKQIAADVEEAQAKPKKPRKKRQTFVILAAKPNKHGFSRGEQLQVLDDGKSWAGCRVQYMSMASTQWIYVLAAGVKVSVRADRVKRAG